MRCRGRWRNTPQQLPPAVPGRRAARRSRRRACQQHCRAALTCTATHASVAAPYGMDCQRLARRPTLRQPPPPLPPPPAGQQLPAPVTMKWPAFKAAPGSLEAIREEIKHNKVS